MYTENAILIMRLIGAIEDDSPGDILDTIRNLDGIEDVKIFFLARNIRWGKIVEEEVKNALDGYGITYFLTNRQYVDLYRENHRIFILRSEMNEYDIWDRIESRKIQVEEFGVSLSQFSLGYACRHETQEFYNSTEWKQKAMLERYKDHNKCWSCGSTNVPLDVHHYSPIISAYSPSFVKNFSDSGLFSYCQSCHKAFHDKHIRGLDHTFDRASREEKIQERENNRLLDMAHDRLRICPFCFDYKSRWQEKYAYWKGY